MSYRSFLPVTGVGCICAAGDNLSTCMKSFFGKGSHPKPPSRFTGDHPVQYPVFEVPEEISLWGGGRKQEVFRTTQLAMTSAQEAISDAGLSKKELRDRRIGVCIGTTVGSAMNNEAFYREFRKGLRPDMKPILKFLNSNPAQVIADEFGLTGPRQTVVNACSSGTDAIGLGALWIRAGICDAVIAGGADELSRITYNGFISLMITDDSPCKPFDRYRRGLNLGEGAAVLILESDESRRIRNHPAQAVLLGYGASCDAYHLTAPDPEGKGLKRAIAAALKENNITTDRIAFVNVHGTGTHDNDRVESKVLNELLPEIPFFSTKGYTGHTLGAAGAIEAAFTIACLQAGEIPVSAGFNIPDPDLPARPVNERTLVTGDVGISESLGFGGNNAVLVFGKCRL